jgi:hypothetical protein
LPRPPPAPPSTGNTRRWEEAPVEEARGAW